MGLASDLLIILSSYSEGYRLMRARAYGFPYRERSKTRTKWENVSENTMRVTVSRLKKNGLVESGGRGVWKLTKKGYKFLVDKSAVLSRHSPRASSKNPKNMIVAFDIPEKSKKKREWLRYELVLLGFAMLQKSVWFGPSPLPQDFIDNLRDLGILQYIKFFKVTEADIV